MLGAKISVLVALVILGSVMVTECSEDMKIMRKLLRDYEKREPDETTQVKLGIYINNMYAISEMTMEYTITFYLRQSWQDKRLEFTPTNGEEKQHVKVPNRMIGQIWVPDTFFRNEKAGNFHHITVPNVLMKVNNTGHVWYVKKITATLSCPMKLQKFPMDTQMCPLMFESFGYTMDKMYFSWLNNPMDVDKSVQLPRYTLKDVILYDCSQNYTAGAFPCLEMRFILRRDTGFYTMQIFFPTVLIVILSWVSFWFAMDDVAARVGIGLTTILTLSLLSAWSRSQIPGVSYLTAIDIWMSMCFIFVFTAFLEFALVNFLSSKSSGDKGEQGTDEKKEEEGPLSKLDFKGGPKSQRASVWIDALAKIIFPVAFILFNIVYWSLHTISTDLSE